MDDTLCDYIGAFLRAKSLNPSVKYPQSVPGFFTDLKPLPGALSNINFLAEDNDVYILTRPSVLNGHCYTEKWQWVLDHLGMNWCRKLIICPDKSLLKGDILIDDVPWNGFEGKQILFNASENDWHQIMIDLHNGTY